MANKPARLRRRPAAGASRPAGKGAEPAASESPMPVRQRTRLTGKRTRSKGSGPGPSASSPPAEAGDEYRVGYGKPPRHTRFKPGRSGNPKGRPKGTKNMKTLIDKELNTKVVVREGGKARQVQKREVIVMQLVKKAAEGQDRSIQILLKMDDELAAAATAQAASLAPPEPSLDETGSAILEAYKSQLIENLGASHPPPDGPAADDDHAANGDDK